MHQSRRRERKNLVMCSLFFWTPQFPSPPTYLSYSTLLRILHTIAESSCRSSALSNRGNPAISLNSWQPCHIPEIQNLLVCLLFYTDKCLETGSFIIWDGIFCNLRLSTCIHFQFFPNFFIQATKFVYISFKKTNKNMIYHFPYIVTYRDKMLSALGPS